MEHVLSKLATILYLIAHSAYGIIYFICIDIQCCSFYAHQYELLPHTSFIISYVCFYVLAGMTRAEHGSMV